MNYNDYKFKFTVIMAVYNVEKYIKGAINSIINQDINFQDNVQLVLVNDGSTDNCESICKNYQQKFPNNIVYVKKENGGVASAKNVGLTYRKGKYINFVDPDDKLTLNTLSEVYNFLELYYNQIDFATIPLYMFEAQKGLHQKYKSIGNKNRIVNLDTEPHNFVLSSAASFYKTEIFNNISFDENLYCSEDLKLNCLIYEKNHCFGYVCENTVKYCYRKREDESSIVDSIKYDMRVYYSTISLFKDILKAKADIEDYLKEIIIYELRSRLKLINKNDFDKESYYFQVIDGYREILSYVDKKHMALKTRMIESKIMRYTFLSNIFKEEKAFKLDDYGFIHNDGFNLFSIGNFEIYIKSIDLDEKWFTIDVLFYDFGIDNIDVVLKTDKGVECEVLKKGVYNTSIDLKYGEFNIAPTTKMIFKIPYRKGKLSFFIRNNKTGLEYKANIIVPSEKSKFILKDKNIKVLHKKYSIRFDGYDIIIKNKFIERYKYNIWSFIHIMKTYKYKAFYRLFNKYNKKYILCCDRPEKASDNGEALFKYINEKERKLAKYTYFVISKKSPDYRRMKKIGKVVDINSVKHKYLFLNSKTIFSSHMFHLFYNPFEMGIRKYYADMFRYKLVWIQHGIILNTVDVTSNKYKTNADYFVTSTNGEYGEVTQDKYLYEKEDILLTGLSRYDYLESKSKDIITVIPTWRTFLSGKILGNGFHETKGNFEESDYYKNYSQLLTNQKLINLLEKKKFTLQFILHPGMAGYEDYFKKYASKNIKIISPNKANYSKIFSESKLLITDYSSVLFDFSYLRKPIILFQFDQKDFFTKHYKKGYFDYSRDGFGDVITDADKVVSKIKYYFITDFKMERKYLDRVDKTFIYTDKNNSKRLLEILKKDQII